MTGSGEDRDRSKRLGAENRGWSTTGRVLGGRTIEMSGDAICGLLHAQGDEEREFPGLASKSRSMVSPNLASKSVATVLMVWPQNHLFEFSRLSLKTDNCSLVIWPTKSSQRFLGLGLKIKWAIIYQLRYKTNGRMKTVWDTH
jgi:hypothetical protein